jgi:hypothetical protein
VRELCWLLGTSVLNQDGFALDFLLFLGCAGYLGHLFRKIRNMCHKIDNGQTFASYAVLPLKMVDKSTSPHQTHLGLVFGDEAVQTDLLIPE